MLGAITNTTGFPFNCDREDAPHFLFACFPFCASDSQTPELHADVFWINAGFLLDGKVDKISKRHLKSMDVFTHNYFTHLAMYFRVHFGEFRAQRFGFPEYQILGVPRELYQANEDTGLHQNPAPHSSILCAKGAAASREQMLECWQRQAVEFGWARKELTALTTSIKRERACLHSPRKRVYVVGSDERLRAMTDHLLRQQQARFYAKRALVAKKGPRV